MKNERGITLVSLVTYIVVMIIVLLIMNSIITTFYSNTESTKASVEEIIEFNKFNMYFLKEIKVRGNNVDQISQDDQNPYILFASGNSFKSNSNKIYYNNIEICNNVKSIKFECEKETDDDENLKFDNIIKVTLNFENFSKSMSYKIENIY